MISGGRSAWEPIHAYGLGAALLLLAPLATWASWSADDSDAVRRLRNGPGVVNHPVGVIPSPAVRIPDGWALDANGAITCLTCHNSIPSLVDQGRPDLRGQTDSSSISRDFCQNCHEQGRRTGSRHSHWSALQRAHLPPDAADVRVHSGGLDNNSARCMSCHDGVSASETHTATAERQAHGSFSERGRNHPIGVAFGGSRTKRIMKLHSASTLPATVRLPQGRVSCVSCHNLYEPTPQRLSVPIEGSKLCMSCHDMN